MVGVTVSPSTVGSPAAGSSSSSSSLFDSVHDHMHHQSDWEDFYESPTGEEEEVYLLMQDMANDLFAGGISENERPKWTVETSGKDVVITFGESRDKVWNIAQEEIEAYRKRVYELTKTNFEDIDPIKDILELFLGKSRPLMHLLMSSLDLSFEKACHFLGTYCVQKAHRLSVKEMYDEIGTRPRLRISDLMTRDEYVGVWRKIASGGTSSEGRNKKQFWQKFQDRMNEAFNEINVIMAGSLIVSLDDDKKKASIGKGKDMQGLKQHVLSDRRKGIVGHTAVSPATLLTLGVCWEMEGQSSYDCYVKLVKEIFGEKPNLDKVTFCSDRGYWILKVLKYLLEHGADVHGTVRRQDWFGLTYDTNLKEGDPRLNINKLGPSTLYAATTEISDRVVTANGYRNGTGGVALTMSSMIHGSQWECVVKESIRISNKIPPVVHPSRRRGLLFRPFGSNVPVDDQVISILGGLNVDHSTEYQGHQEWHWGRRFSSTSTGVATQVPIQMRMDKERDERRPQWIVMEEYLSTSSGIGGTGVSGSTVTGEATGDETEQSGPESSETESGSTDITAGEIDEANKNESAAATNGPEDVAGGDDITSVDDETKQRVKDMIKDAADTTDRCAAIRQTLIDELKNNGHKDIVEELVRQMGGKVYKSYGANRKSAIAWLESDPRCRPFVFWTLPQLRAKYRETKSSKIPSTINNKQDLIKVLSGMMEAPLPSQANVTAKTPIEAVIQSSYLPPLKGENAELCKLGHQMEPIYGTNILELGKEGIKLEDGKVLIVQHLFRAGLVQKRGRKYQKDSPDFILIGTLDGAPIVAVVEMKCRSKTKTQDAERRRAGYGNFASVSCDSPDLRKFMLKRDEALQCAHHASTLSVNYVLFVTGDRVSTTGGVLIHFDNEFLSSYDKCIDDIYESAFKWAYEAESEDDMPIDEIKSAVSNARVPLDFETVMKHYYVWKEMTKDENLPLPPCERILPTQDGYWNVTKHGSDTKTQACQRMSVPLPVDAPGAKAYDRMQMNIFADIHKGSQMFRANEDLKTYGDIEHYRNAASHQMSFRKCIIDISDLFLNIANGVNCDSTHVVVTPQQPIRPNVHIPNTSAIRRKTEDVCLPRKETGRSPKKNKLKRLLKPSSADERAASKRFKACIGRPVFRVNEENGDLRGAGAEGTCIVCNSKTNWYCIGCGNWCCANKSPPEGADYFRDVNTYCGINGVSRHITGKMTCLMSCHPQYLTSSSSVENEEA